VGAFVGCFWEKLTLLQSTLVASLQLNAAIDSEYRFTVQNVFNYLLTIAVFEG
jgi:hypothetical protein